MDEFVRYRIAGGTIDGPGLPDGAEVGLKVLAVVQDGPAPLGRFLSVRDWSGPWPERHNPPADAPIAPHILNACANALATLAQQPDRAEHEHCARLVLETAARLISPADEASRIIEGVLRQDIAKLARAGDRLHDVTGEARPDRSDAMLAGALGGWRRVRKLYGPKAPAA